jgi:hypothetical protein
MKSWRTLYYHTFSPFLCHVITLLKCFFADNCGYIVLIILHQNFFSYSGKCSHMLSLTLLIPALVFRLEFFARLIFQLSMYERKGAIFNYIPTYTVVCKQLHFCILSIQKKILQC